MTRPLHLALTALLFGCGAYYAGPEGDAESAALVRRYAPVLEDAGLSTVRLAGLRVRVMPGGDGGSFPPPPTVKGMKWLYDYGGEACASYPGERVLWVASLDSPYVCHGFGHVARTDVYRDGVGCLDPNDDHGFFDSVSLDAHCREAAR